ncbi:MAG: ribonuclease HII, partial [Firmicutes bacterium]|nr:ribonuclease HII [Bacillota bacterium]
MRSIAEIKEELAAVNIADIKKALKQYKDDERAGVKKLVESFEKKYDAYLKEQKRLDMMLEYENKYYSKGSEYIAGVDEVGRGPLA